METVTPFKEIIDAIKASGGEAFKSVLPVRPVRRRLPLEPGAANFSMRKIVREATFGLTEIESEDIWRCTTCGKCPQLCPRDVKQIESGVALRRIATEYGVFPPRSQPMRGRRREPRGEGNPFGEERAKRGRLGRGLWASSPSPRGWSSSTSPAATSATTPGRRRSRAPRPRSSTRRAWISASSAPKESCCGESIRKTGDEDAVQGAGAAEHQGLHRPRGEEDPGVLAALLSHLQERVPGVHGALRGGPHLAAAPS